MAHFQIENLTFSYAAAKGKHSLQDVNLTIEKGEYIVLCGKSGSGKTTLLKHLKSVLTPSGKRSGTILFNGMLCIFLGVGFLLCGKYGFALLGGLVGYGFALRRGYKSLEGMNGDISGYALTIGELCAVAVYALL